MKHEFAAVLIDLDDRITPAEIGVEMVERDGQVHRGHCRNNPSRIQEQHGKPPLFSTLRFSRIPVILQHTYVYSVAEISMRFSEDARGVTQI